ncbi:MAG: hypothetical protein IT425_07210 [Pirellulales bacterium]|nr:hypothetical protein [Pirellulales bacterium]
MRTTVTIDPDVEQLLRTAMERSGESFKGVLNRAIKKGLAGEVPSPTSEPFVVKGWDMGCKAGIDIANVHDLEHEWDVERFLRNTADRARLMQRKQSD